MWMRVKTFGSAGARSAVTLTRQPRTSCRPRLQDQDDVVGAAGAGAGEHRLHRPRREIAAAAVRRAVHRQQMAAAGLGREGHAVAAGIQSIVHSIPVAPSRDIALQQKTRLNSFRSGSRTAVRSGPGCRTATDCLLHLLMGGFSPGQRCLGLFLGRGAGRADTGTYDAAPQSSAAGDTTRHGEIPPQAGAEEGAPRRKPALAGYLQKILTARVYDVAIEIAARRRRRASRPGSATRCCSSARTRSRCSASSCAAPTTRWRTSRRRSWRAA